MQSPAECPNVPAIGPQQWALIDTVLLDLDGTLLDLGFDNYFWRTCVPQAWAQQHGCSLATAQAQLQQRFQSCEGTLDWYCLEYWTRELKIDIVALKLRDAHLIRWLPQAPAFLRGLRQRGKRLVLLTNAHPTALAIKDARTQVISYFDAGFSSHVFGAPKEHAGFWRELAKVEVFDPARSLFVDDSLPVLRAARAAGIGLIYGIRRPDSLGEARVLEEFPAVDSVAQLL